MNAIDPEGSLSMVLLIGVLLLGMLLGGPLMRAFKAAMEALKHFLLVGLVVLVAYLAYASFVSP